MRITLSTVRQIFPVIFIFAFNFFACDFLAAAGVCDPFIVSPASSSIPGGPSVGPPSSFPGSFNVYTEPAGCPWAATNNGNSWITITSGFSGSSNGTVTFSVAKNPSAFGRTGIITAKPVLGLAVGNITHTVYQGGADEVCISSISPTNASFGWNGGTGSVTVSIPHGCPWTTVKNAAWVTIQSGSSGVGPGQVTYKVAINNSFLSRSTTLQIAGQNFKISQGPRFIGIPIVYQFFPRFGPPGTQVQIQGENFGEDIDSLSVGVMSGNGFVPIKVLRVSDGEILGELGPAGPNATPGPIVVTSGEGANGFFKPVLADIFVPNTAWAWKTSPFTGTGTSQDTFQPQPQQPQPNTRWFFSGPPSNGVLSLTIVGNWYTNNKVSVRVSAHDHEGKLGRELRVDGVEFPGNGTLLDCARRLCDVIRCALNQQGAGDLNCELQLTGAAAPAVKITLSMPDGHISWGNFDVCIEPAQPPPVPSITSFSPRSGGEGTEVVIAGQNFGGNPRNVSAAIVGGGLTIPLEIVSAGNTEIRARLGKVPPRATAGLIQVALGDGNRTLVEFAHGDLRQPVWIGTLYDESAAPPTTSRDTFTPQPQPDPPTWPKCYFSDPASGGKICLTLTEAWPTPASVSISAGLFDSRSGKGREIKVPNVEFTGATITTSAGTIIDPLNLLECAYRICDVIGSGSFQGGGFVVDCNVEFIAPNAVQICLSMVNGFADSGHLNVCVQPALVPADNRWPIIFDFFPKEGSPGDAITIVGRNFIGNPDEGPNPDDLSIAIVNGATTIPMQVIHATDTEIIAVLDDVPPDARSGPLRLRLGRGVITETRNLPPQINWASSVPVDTAHPTQAMWSWQGGAAYADSVQNFNPSYKPPPIGQKCYYSGPPVNGDLIVVLPDFGSSSSWPSPSWVSIDFEGISECVPINLKILQTQLLGGGTVLQCAQKICDIIENAFIANTNPPTPQCSVQQGTNTVIIRVTGIVPGGIIPFGCSPDIISGHLNICVKKATIILNPNIINFLPLQAREGDIIAINGSDFGNNPDNICAIIMDGANSIPLEVIEATGNQIKAVLGAVPPNASPGPIMVGLGAGAHGTFIPAVQDTEVRKRVWVWDRTGADAQSAGTLRPVPTTPPPGTQWFFSGPPSNGVLSVTIDGSWPSNAQVRIEARAHDHQRGIGHDLRAVDVRFPNGGTVGDCAARICDVIQSAFLQQAGIVVDCSVQAGRSTATLFLRLPDGVIDWGNFNVCVRPAPDLPPVIRDFTPRAGPIGTIVTITGNNFISSPGVVPDPNDYCVVHMDGGLSTPFEVLSVTSTQITARLSAVDPSARPGKLMVGLGQGQLGAFTPRFSDVIPLSQVWTWNKDGGSGTSSNDFAPVHFDPPPTTRWFFGGPPVEGKLCVYLSGDWPRPSIVRIEARAHNHGRNIGHDLRAVAVRFEGGGTLLDCAYRICDVIRGAFLQEAGIVVNCTVTPQPSLTPIVKITLSLPEGQIDWGNLNVCVESEPPIPAPVITSVSPLLGGEGTLLTIVGRNFLGGPDTIPDDLCAVVMDGNRSVPIQVMSATDTTIQGILGPVAPDARGGAVMVGLGKGRRAFFQPLFGDIRQNDPTWTWVKTGPAGTGTQTFSLISNAPQANVIWFFSGPPVDGKLSVLLQGDWPAPSRVRISARAHDTSSGVGRDLSAINIDLPSGGSLMDCARRICDMIRSAFLQQAGITMNCSVEMLTGAPFARLTLSLPEGHISWGNLDVCVEAQASQPAISITGLFPPSGSNDTLVRITGRGFGNNPYNLSLALRNGSDSILLRALEATDTAIIAKVGQVAPNSQPGPIELTRGIGSQVRLPGDLAQPLSGSWGWKSSTEPSTLSTLNFTPVYASCFPPNSFFFQQTMYSFAPVDGALCVTIPDGLAFINKADIEIQAHNDSLRISRDLDFCFCFGPANSSAETKATIFCSAIADAFADQGVTVNCTVVLASDGATKLCLSLPEGPIEWGTIKICLQDGEALTCPCNPTYVKFPFSVVVQAILGERSLQLMWPRTATGYELQETDSLGGPVIDWLPTTMPLRASDTELMIEIPVDPSQPQQFFRLHRPQFMQPGGD